jgi:hypothetical protein
MNLDKTIQELTNRLNEILPVYSASSSDFKNDGINYWKGKRIISVKEWNELYEKSSTYTNSYTNSYKSILASRKPLQYFPDDYNGSISTAEVVDEKLKEEVQKWNTDYYKLLEYRKNPILGRMKCSKCLLSGSNDDPIFVGIEKVFARIVSNQCNNNIANDQSHGLITYHCTILNIFSCPFENKKEAYNKKEEIESIYSYKREDLFALHKISFVIEQAISTFFEITKNNEIIYKVDFEKDRVQEIHTKYNGEPENWGWLENVKEILSKVKPISNIVIRDERDIYHILTNREKLEYLFQGYEKEINHQLEEKQEELELEDLKPELKAKMKDEFKQYNEEQIVILKQNKQNIINFLLDNKESIRIDDLKIYEPIYKCYREKGHCHICNALTNIVCINRNNSHNNNKEVWLCTNHWNQHAIENHAQ